MNICFVALSFKLNGEPASGVTAQVRAIAEGLAVSGHSVHVVTLGENEETITDGGIRVHQVTTTKLHWYVTKVPLLGKLLSLPLREIEYSVAAFRGLRRAHAERTIDLIEGTETGNLFLRFASRGAPIIIRLHGEQYTFHKYTPELKLTSDVRLSRVLQRIGLRKANLLISPSAAHAQEISKELRGKHPTTRVIPNSVCHRETHHETGSGDSVIFVGRLDRVKGVRVFLQAAARVRNSYPQAEFVVAGTSHPTLSQAEIDQLIHSHSLESCVRQFGYLSAQDLASLYQRASLCVVPSYYESFGLVALEAMIHEVPVVAARGGGLAEVVEDGVTGVLVSAGDVHAFAEAIKNLLADARTRSRMGEAARHRAATHFAFKEVSKLNLTAYEDVCDRRVVHESAKSADIVNGNLSLEQN